MRLPPIRVPRLILVAACVLFAGVGVSLLFLGPAPDLVLGIGAIALALSVLGVTVILSVPPGEIVARTIEVDGNSRPAFVAEFSRMKAGIAGGIVAGFAIGAAAVLAIADGARCCRTAPT